MIVYVVMYEECTYEGYNLHSVWANEQDAIDMVEKISEPGHHALFANVKRVNPCYSFTSGVDFLTLSALINTINTLFSYITN